MSDSEVYRQQMVEAGCRQNRHVVLNSGRHSNAKIDAEKLLERKNTMRRRSVVDALARLIEKGDYDGYLPVPNGMSNIMRETTLDIPTRLPMLISTIKTAKRSFEIGHPTNYGMVKLVDRLAVVDDVVTTGNTALALAQTIRGYGSGAEFDLYGIWRRGELSDEVKQFFGRQIFLIEESVPSWPAEDCQQCQ